MERKAAAAEPDDGPGRVTYLDGLRGVAVVAVMAWHYTDRTYHRFLPHGALYADAPVLDHGWVGVNLFFLISGYVIRLTLERCSGFGEFMARRWSRLFPAMLLASVLVFGASQAIGGHMPHGRAEPVDLLPGLTFVIPTFWEAALGRPVGELDGVYWTLYVEMGFYLLFGLLWFRLGARAALVGLALVWIGTAGASRLAAAADLPALATAVTPLQWIGAEYFGWFASGALFREAARRGSGALSAAAVLTGCAAAFTSDLWQPGDPVSRAYLIGCVLLFAGAQRFAWLQRPLASPVPLFAGAISYPLYLLHNELGIGLMGWAGARLPAAAAPWLPFVTAGVVVAVAWLVARRIEPVATEGLRRLLLRRGA